MTINVKILRARNEIVDTAHFAYCCGLALAKTATGTTKFVWNLKK